MRAGAWLAERLAWITALGALAAWLAPAPFLPLGKVFLPLFALVMFALGLVLDLEEARAVVARPLAVAQGVTAQYLIMPVLGWGAFALARALGEPPALALGFAIVGAAPGAMASNVVAHLVGGSAAYSIALTLVATLLSPLVTPLWVEWIAGATMEIPVLGMMRTILFAVVLPLVLGVLLQGRLRRPWSEDAAKGLAALAIVAICAYAVAANHARIAKASLLVFALVVAINLLGYALGWLAGRLYRLDARLRLTLMIEIGMQNAGLGAALALAHFAPITALPAALFAFWCVLTASALGRWIGSMATGLGYRGHPAPEAGIRGGVCRE